MNKEQATQLVRIYNTLMTVNTSGKDTVVMGRCLEAFEELILQFNKNSNNINKEE